MEKYEHNNHFKIKYCEVDFKDEIKLSALLAYLEEVSCSSADELGFGYEYVKARNYAFFVSGYRCDFIKPIRLGQTICVTTWPTPPKHVIFGREYQIRSVEKEILLNATSRWCLMDMQSGKILPSKLIDNQDYSSYNTTKLFPEWRWKIPTFSTSEGILKFSITIANSEYDHNMHVNNTRYADYCLNCFGVAELQEKKLKSFAILYIKQCKEGETLHFYRKFVGEDEYLVHGFNECGEVVVQSQICFEKNNGTNEKCQ